MHHKTICSPKPLVNTSIIWSPDRTCMSKRPTIQFLLDEVTINLYVFCFIMLTRVYHLILSNLNEKSMLSCRWSSFTWIKNISRTPNVIYLYFSSPVDRATTPYFFLLFCLPNFHPLCKIAYGRSPIIEATYQSRWPLALNNRSFPRHPSK
jgi:hypothetical protein